MKKIDQIREQYDLITEKEEAETRKLTTLVRAGLFDPKKLPMLKRALNKDPKDMTPAERKILIELLDSLMAEVLQSQQVYSKVKQNVMMKEENLEEVKGADNYYSKYDPRYTKMPTDREIPTIIILKRKAIRIYPDNQKVALYYSQALDKYVTIPFGTFGDAPMNEAVVIGDDDEEDKKDYGYQMKKSYIKYKNPEDHKNIIRMKGELDSMKRKMASGGYKEGKSKQTASQTISSREAALQKLKQKAPQEKITKTVPGGDPSKLSKGNFKKLMKSISNSNDMNFATKFGTKIGLRARRAVDKTLAAGSDKLNHAFEESEIKAKFYAKRKQQVDEQALPKSDVEIKTYKPTTDYKPSEKPANVNKPLEKGKSVVPSVKGKEIELPSAVKGAVAGRKFGLPGMVAGAVLNPDKAGEKPEELPVAKTIKQIQGLEGQQRFRPAPDSNKEVSFEKPQKPVDIPIPTPTPVKPEPATKPSAPESKPAVDTSKLPEVSRRDVLDDLTSVLGMTSAAKGIQSLRNRKGGPKKGDKDLSDVNLPNIELPSLKIDKGYTPPKEFGLKAKTSAPKGDVRTTVQARDTSLYRKSLQAEESNSTISVVKSYTPPKEFALSSKIIANQSKGKVRTSVDTRDTIQYRKSLQQNESVLNTLYNIKENEEKAIEIANESVVINNTVANKIIGLYESVNKNNKEKIETMLNESVDSFKKIASFAARQ